jgi:hypothetical protein
MHAIVAEEAPSDHGREQMKAPAGLEVTTKSVERSSEAIRADVAQRERAEIQKALRLELPVDVGEPIRILFVGSGATEAGCKTAVASRLNRPGMLPFEEPTRSWLYADAIAMATLKVTGARRAA